MAKLPRNPARPLPAPFDPIETLLLPAHRVLWRIYRAGGRDATSWWTFRTYGPVARGRFDPHPLPPGDQPGFGVLYAALDIPTAVAEAFGDDRFVDRRRDRPYLAGFPIARDAGVLDLASDWPTRAGGSQLLSAGPRPTAQNWARAIHEDLDVDGLAYPSSMKGNGTNVVLFERARNVLPGAPLLNLPLDHTALEIPLIRITSQLGYGIA